MNYIKTRPSKNNRTYKPINKNKYTGQYPIWVRSELEERFCKILDTDLKVVEWSSEPISIPYMFQGKKKNYYPDYYCVIRLPNGSYEKWLVEIKPYSQTIPPTRSKKKAKKTMLYENFTWNKNTAKWKSAKIMCKKMNWIFKIITEKQLFKK